MSADETESLSSSRSSSFEAGGSQSAGESQEIDLVDEILGGLARATAEEAGTQPGEQPGAEAAVRKAATTEPALWSEPAAAPDPADSKLSGTKSQQIAVAVSQSAVAGAESLPAATGDAAAQAVAAQAVAAEAVAAEAVAAEAVAAEAVAAPPVAAPAHPSRSLRHPLAGARSAGSAKEATSGPSWRFLRFVLAFALTGGAVLLLLVAVAAGVRSMYSDKVVPGVRIGSVDVSGLTQDQVAARLKSTYGYLSQGEVTVTTATGTAKISYAQTGRGPDVGTMAYEAMRVGHTGDPIADTVAIFRSAIGGETVPLSVTLDPKAVATQVRALVATDLPPEDARATIANNAFALKPAAEGRGIDEVAISSAIVEHLGQPNQAPEFQAGGAFIILKPTVPDSVAQAAIDDAQKMLVGIKLTYSDPIIPPATPSGSASASPTVTPTPSPTPASSQSPAPVKTFDITSDTVLSWINFSFNANGQYVASVDEAKIQASIAAMNINVGTKPVEPTVTFDPTTGHPAGVQGGIPGSVMDLGATAHAVATYLSGLVSGASPGPVAIVTSDVAPQISVDSLNGMVIIGSATVTFYPDISNGNGANIRTPAKILSGQVVAPGQQFSFLGRVGPIDPAHGFTLGGVIEHGKSDHTGAMGGGICSASTTMFNAAAKAGLQMDERHNHAYYIDRYPVGLDATVFSNGYQTYDMKWTNDTPNPIVIRGTSTKGSKSSVTFQLWSLPLDRTVVFSPEYKANVSKATDSTVYTTAIPVGTKNRAEYPSDGFDTSRTRTVTDASGKVIHTDTWKSRYITVNGILQIGVAATPPPVVTPPPAATPTPAP
jgi:vancomycin resistance protein YoaR